MVDAKFMCAAQLCAFCCALSSVASSLPVSAGLLHTGFIVPPAALHITPRLLGSTFLNVAECSECSLLNKVCRNMWHYSRCCVLQMLVMGFPSARLERLPKTRERRRFGREHHLPVKASAFSDRPQKCLVWDLYEGIFFAETVLLQKMNFHCAWILFARGVFRKLVEEFVWPG